MFLVVGCSVGIGGSDDLGGNTLGGDDDGGTAGTGADDASGPDDGVDDGVDDDAGTDGVDDGPADTGIDPNEMCNGLDDDADGMVDEGIADITCGEGICMATVPGCQAGAPGQCFPGQPGTESCNGLDDDCDGSTDEELAQACDSSCGPGTQSCSGGAWGECDAPPPMAESCDVVDNDCNGAVDDGVAGCRVDVHRSWHPVTGEHFYTTSLEEAQCCGFQLEFQNFYRLYAGPQAQTTPFYRCVGTMHHYTTDPNCEGLTLEGAMGYIGTAQLPGSTALYRSYNPQNGDHFFTNSQNEHDNAVNALGFVDEGVVGYVW